MKRIGDKLKDVRKIKGLSQEELADKTNVNIRTIQRIEKNESEPRGNTINQICSVLDLNIEDILDYGKEEDNNYLVFFHFSVMSALFIPLGNLLVPYILWSNKKDKVVGLNSIGVNLLNFQIVFTAVTTFLVMISALIKVLHLGDWFKVGLPISVLLYFLLNLVLPIIFGIRIRNGKREHLYPNIIKVIK